MPRLPEVGLPVVREGDCAAAERVSVLAGGKGVMLSAGLPESGGVVLDMC